MLRDASGFFLALSHVHTYPINTFQLAHAVDLAASPPRPNSMIGCLPCLTSSRASTSPPFITKLGRQLGTNELLRAQGFEPREVGWSSHLSKRQIGAAVGNAITLPVLKKLLVNLLEAQDAR